MVNEPAGGNSREGLHMKPGYIAFLLLFVCLFPASGQEDTLTLTFLGDIMIHSVNYRVPDYHVIYTAITPYLKQDDLTFANLEFPLDPARPYADYPCFNGSLSYVTAAVRAGVDVFSLANNHSFDQGRAGVLQSIRVMEKLGILTGRRIAWSGLRGNLSRPFRPVEIYAEGFKIGFLAVTQMVNRPMDHGYVQIVDYHSRSQRRAFLERLRAVTPAFDLFILSYHGGHEYALQPEPEKIAFFKELTAAGVHIVYAHHPHVPQGSLLMPAAAAGGGMRLIIASAGNLISGMTWSIDPGEPENPRAFTGDSALWSVRVARRDGCVAVEQVRSLLVTNHRNTDNELVVIPFSDLLGQDLPASWRAYYQRRFNLLRAHLAGALPGKTALSLTGED
jgi:poly-gamma-glutamate capsule biosynthesis protein CapA/YwtB (metallophosphatase superfamily)